jgi:hypothetical protein
MSRKRTVVSCLGAVVLMAGTRAGAEPEPVPAKGTGYAATKKPPSISNPPASWLGTENQHDVDEGVVYDGVTHYELRQGARHDNKHAWRGTDYIHWEINGATLEAEGQAQDADSEEATTVSSEAWGAQVVLASVNEGRWATISAINTVGFDYAYKISGKYIGEAAVQLLGQAVDIDGQTHEFSLDEEVGENVTQETERKFGLSLSRGSEAAIGISNRVIGGTLGGTQGLSASGALSVRITRRQATSAGGAGSTDRREIRDSVSGHPPLFKRYAVYSGANVVLVARAAQDPNSEGSSAVVVRLHLFKVENNLQVTKQVWPAADPGTPGDPTPPGNPEGEGPTTPGGGGSSEEQPGGDEGHTHDGEEEPAEEESPEEEPAEEEPTEEEPADEEEDESTDIPGAGDTSATPSFEAPHGLDGEPGSLAGRLRVRLSRPVSSDIVFAIDVEPSDRLDVNGRDRLVVAAGRRWASLPFHAREEGVAAVTLTVLDASGNPTRAVLAREVAVRSVDSYPEPRLWATFDGQSWEPGRDGSVQAVRGEDLGHLRIGRLGFGGLATEATVVTVEVDDASGILPGLPPFLTIAAGETHTSLPVRLNDAAGTATLTLRAGEQAVQIFLASRAQEWRSLAEVRIPLGAVAPIPYALAFQERTARDVGLAISDASVLALAESDAVDRIRAGGRAWFFHVRGEALGKTTVELSSPGLPPLTVPVEVVPALVRVENGHLTLTGLDGTREGEIRLWVQEGAVIERLDLPAADAEDYLHVSGVGTREATLRFSPSADLPASLTLPIAFGGAPNDDLELGVLDTMHVPEGEKTIVGYHIAVR